MTAWTATYGDVVGTNMNLLYWRKPGEVELVIIEVPFDYWRE